MTVVFKFFILLLIAKISNFIMENTKKDEKNIVLELKHQLGRMMVQVDYMYRNDREMSRLDLDVMMERTRDIYELLCDYQADAVAEGIGDERVNAEINEGGEFINHDVELEIDNNSSDKADTEEPEHQDELKHVLEVDENDGDNVDEDEEDWEDEEDQPFNVDNSLAARLKRTPVDDIRTALGINDKMMIINDLFKGSFERYNKSIEALNEFPTLSGAKVYMNELQVELQWDTESEAYQLLNDLVERRFI